MKNPITLGIIALLVAGGAFYGGMQFQVSVQATADAARQAARGQGGAAFGGRGGSSGQGGGAGRGAPTVGKVLSKDEASMTVELAAGGSKIIILSGETKAMHTTDIGLDTVKVGDTVTVMGSTNTDGSVTASRIETGAVRQFGSRNGSTVPSIQ
jgi:hypothetical protein